MAHPPAMLDRIRLLSRRVRSAGAVRRCVSPGDDVACRAPMRRALPASSAAPSRRGGAAAAALVVAPGGLTDRPGHVIAAAAKSSQAAAACARCSSGRRAGGRAFALPVGGGRAGLADQTLHRLAQPQLPARRSPLLHHRRLA